MNELYFQMLRNGIEELRTEKYSIERNGISEALQITLNNLQDKVKNHVVLDNVVLQSEQLPEKCIEKGESTLYCTLYGKCKQCQ